MFKFVHRRVRSAEPACANASNTPPTQRLPRRCCSLCADAQPAAAPAAKTEWTDHEHPWYASNQSIASQSLCLHNEIVELTTLLQPTEEEDEQRRAAAQQLEGVVRELFPGASLEVRLAAANVAL
jgi:hypothetical protein